MAATMNPYILIYDLLYYFCQLDTQCGKCCVKSVFQCLRVYLFDYGYGVTVLHR